MQLIFISVLFHLFLVHLQHILVLAIFLLYRLIFETALKLRGGPSFVFAHSMGNNVFRYFLEWLKLEIAPKHYIQWLDEHILAYFAVGT
jgi:Lecithin:cholesterol acyltransferase